MSDPQTVLISPNLSQALTFLKNLTPGGQWRRGNTGLGGTHTRS